MPPSRKTRSTLALRRVLHIIALGSTLASLKGQGRYPASTRRFSNCVRNCGRTSAASSANMRGKFPLSASPLTPSTLASILSRSSCSLQAQTGVGSMEEGGARGGNMGESLTDINTSSIVLPAADVTRRSAHSYRHQHEQHRQWHGHWENSNSPIFARAKSFLSQALGAIIPNSVSSLAVGIVSQLILLLKSQEASAHILPPESDWIEEEIPGMAAVGGGEKEMKRILERYLKGDDSVISDQGLNISFCMDRESITFSAPSSQNGDRSFQSWLAKVVDTMRKCGVVIVTNVFDRRMCAKVRRELLKFQCEKKKLYERLSTWQLRKGRTETFVPSSIPIFRQKELIANPIVTAVMDRYFSRRRFREENGGSYFNADTKAYLDLVTWISALPKAENQGLHRDVLWGGSTTVHVVLHDLSEDFAPTVFWPATHKDTLLDGSVLSLDMLAAIAPMGSAVMYDSSILHYGGSNKREQNRHALFLDYMADELHGKKYPFFIKASIYPKEKEKGILSNIFAMRESFGEFIHAPPPWRLEESNANENLPAFSYTTATAATRGREGGGLLSYSEREKIWNQWLDHRINYHKDNLRRKRGIRVVD